MSDIGVVTHPATAEAAGRFAYDLIRARAQVDGAAPALVDLAGGSRTALSYAELVGRVDALSRRLRSHGVGPEQPVAVLLDRSVDTVVAMLAVLNAGGGYCPLDVAAPQARTSLVMGNLGARVAVADSENARKLPGGPIVVDPAAVSVPGDPAPDPSAPSDPSALDAPDPAALAYVLYTSGSTGMPKGVAMTHRGLSRLIRWQVGSAAAGLRTLQFTATSFDVTFQEVLSTLATGGCLVVASEDIRRDSAALLDTILGQRIQRLFLPYVALQLLAVTATRRGAIPASLEHVVTAGERLIITPEIRALFASIPHCRLDNHYGPTEAHLVTSFTLPPDAEAWPAVPPIGVPVDGVSCWVLDDRLGLAEEGQVGELYVGGIGLARGYLGDPARTAERFVASPFRPGERLYRTGDLVRASSEGNYEFVGRADNQLKVRGFRVEAAEVENALLSHPRVDAAAVGLREIADGVPVLVGYLQTNGSVSHRELTDHLRGQLPAYMVPTRYLPVPELPRTATGKVDGQALAALELPGEPATAQALTPPPVSVAAELSLAELITAIWVRVLGHDEFAVDDDFFEVGGDSLLATWVVAELGQALGRPVELSAFLDDSTIEDLAASLAPVAEAPARPDRQSQIVTLRAGPSARSLYLVHPLGGELIGYRELARSSHAPVRLLGIGWSGRPPPAGASLAEIARVHIEQLRVVEPDGPYWLAGWSFGGVLAYEIAQQLYAGGSTVQFLGMLDANPLIDPITGLPMAQTPYLRLLDDVLERLEDPDSTGADLAELTSGQTWLQLMGAPVAPNSSSGYLRTVLRTARCCMDAAMRYQPEPYPGPLHLFQAGDAGPERQARLAGAIRELCLGPCTVTSIPGDHWGFIRGEHVTDAAAQLDAALERTGTAGSGTYGS